MRHLACLSIVVATGCSNLLGFQDPAGHRPDGGGEVVIDATVLDDGHVVPRPDAPIPTIDAAPGTPDAGIPDADTMPDAFVDTTIATINDPCTETGKLMCAGHAQTSYVVCDGSKYQFGNQCGPGTLCDTEPGANQGTCQPILPECTYPGKIICTGPDLEFCGVDRLTSSTATCVSNAACLASTGPTCAECGDVGDCAGATATLNEPIDVPALATSGAKAPVTYFATGLPPGVTLQPDGTFVGVPTSAGAFTPTVTAVDSTGACATISSTVSVASSSCPAITITPSTLDRGVIGYSYDTFANTTTLTASGGSAPYTFTLLSGALPKGLQLSTSGTLSGTPSTVGKFPLIVLATDSSGCAGTATYTLDVSTYPGSCEEPTSTYSSTPGGTVGHAYSGTIGASPYGGNPPYTYALASGALPTGLVLLPDGSLVGVPTATGAFNFDVTATDSSGCESFAYNFSISIASSACAVSLSPASLPSATANAAYDQTISASGGKAGSYAYKLLTGTNLFSIDASTGELKGTPTSPGTVELLVEVTDGNNCAASLDYALDVAPTSCPTAGFALAPGVDACHIEACTAGACTTAPLPDGTFVSNANPSDCDQTLCEKGTPTVVVDTDENCGTNTQCTAVDTCVGNLGATCDPAKASFCVSGNCVDGVCCDGTCNGTCQTCGGTGMCHAVVQSADDSCPANQACNASSVCAAAIGQPCGSDGDCAWGSCVQTYLDFDYDTYGVTSQPTGMRCVYNHQGNGYSDRGGDCCDSDGWANPSVTYNSSFTTADRCGSWDYSCDGVLESPYANSLTCAQYTQEYWVAGSPPACGTNADVYEATCDASCNCSNLQTLNETNLCW